MSPQFQFNKRAELFIRSHNETLAVAQIFDCRMANDPAMMSSANPARLTAVRSESINNCLDSSGQRYNLDRESKLREKQARVDILDHRCYRRRRRVLTLIFARYDLIASLIGEVRSFSKRPRIADCRRAPRFPRHIAQ